MGTARTWSSGPYKIAILHGGPGAAGEMAPVACELSSGRGILEPFQTERTLDGQVNELAATLNEEGNPPVTIIGFSWGAFLGYILAARQPSFVKKLILVGSPPFEESYAGTIAKTRLSRLKPEERKEAGRLSERLLDPAEGGRNQLMARFGALMAHADGFDTMPCDDTVVEFTHDIFRQVWGEAEGLRRSGELLNLGRQIHCPVIAIHGDFDPHPADGVREPLARTLADFRFILLPRCGHRPWIERYARDEFYTVLNREL